MRLSWLIGFGRYLTPSLNQMCVGEDDILCYEYSDNTFSYSHYKEQ